jgi:hypothetical protein
MAAAAMFVVSGSALVNCANAAPILVDDFSTKDATRSPAFPQSVNTNTGSMTGGTESGLTTLGGTRFSSLGNSTVTVSGFDSATINVFNSGGFSFFDYSSSVGAQASAGLGYGTVSPLNTNATGQTFLRLDLLDYDGPAGSSLQVQANITSSAGGGTFSLPSAIINVPGPTSVNLSLAGLSAATLADIDRIDVTFVAPKSGDFRVDTVQFVPEPATVGMLMLGAFGAAAIRRPRPR